MSRALVVAAILLLCTGCAQQSSPNAKTLTERQRDSLIARSRLPGAPVVGRAMAASDRATDQAAATNAEVDSLFR